MCRVDEVELVEVDSLIKGCRYRICMMAELDKIRLPFYLHYVLFFPFLVGLRDRLVHNGFHILINM